jgi:hypothetical protein
VASQANSAKSIPSFFVSTEKGKQFRRQNKQRQCEAARNQQSTKDIINSGLEIVSRFVEWHVCQRVG